MNDGRWIKEDDYFRRMEDEIYEEIRLIRFNQCGEYKYTIKVLRISDKRIIIKYEKINKGTERTMVLQDDEIYSISNYLYKQGILDIYGALPNKNKTMVKFICVIKKRSHHYVD